MQIKKDSADQEYIDVGNIRITYLPKCKWYPQKSGLRFQAYKDGQSHSRPKKGQSRSLNPGPELALESDSTKLELFNAVDLLLNR